MTDDQTPFFARRLPILQFLQGQDQMLLTQTTSNLFPSLTHYHQMMALSAGIAGLLVPLLHAQGPALMNPWFLHRAAICMLITILVGAVIQAISRWVLVAMVRQLGAYIARRSQLLGEAPDDEDSLSEAWATAGSELTARLKPFRAVTWWGALGDLLFYGSFIRGVVYLVEGFVL